MPAKCHSITEPLVLLLLVTCLYIEPFRVPQRDPLTFICKSVQCNWYLMCIHHNVYCVTLFSQCDNSSGAQYKHPINQSLQEEDRFLVQVLSEALCRFLSHAISFGTVLLACL